MVILRFYVLGLLKFSLRGKCLPKNTCNYSLSDQLLIKVKSMQGPGTKAIRTQIQPSKSKREITKITNSQNTKRIYGQPSEQLFPKRWPLSNPNRTKDNMNTRKQNVNKTPTPKPGNREPQQNYRLGTASNELLGALNYFHGPNLTLNICSGSLVHIIRTDGK